MTNWFNYGREFPRRWLLSNGSIITEPPLEISQSKLRVRVVGAQRSAYNTRLEDMLQAWALEAAQQRHSSLWLELTQPFVNRFEGKVKFKYPEKAAILHLLNPGQGLTTAWWLFEDTSTPFKVLVVAQLSRQTSTTGTPHRTIVSAYVPTINHNGVNDVVAVQNSDFGTVIDSVLKSGTQRLWRDFILNNPTSWAVGLGVENHAEVRTAVETYLRDVQRIEDLDSIQVPDTSNLSDPGWLTLELLETNVNASFINDLTEFLDGTPTADQAAQHYSDMLATLRQAGVSVTAMNENDFLKVMLSKEEQTIQILHLAEEGGRNAEDHLHELHVHLPTGAFIVECSVKQQDQEAIDAWNEAKMVASLTGEEDALLAYAHAFAKKQRRKRTKTILAERGATK